MNKTIKNYLPAVLWAILITWLSVMPGANMPDLNFWEPDKMGHLFVYGMLVFLILWGYQKNGNQLHRKNYSWIVLGSSIYGIILECVQYFISVGRYFENLDILANIIGSIVGSSIFYFLHTRK